MKDRALKIGFISLLGLLLLCLVQLTISSVHIERLTHESEVSNAVQQTHIIVIAQELDNPFWRLVEEGARKASLQHAVQIDYIGPQRNDANEQIRLLEKALTASPDGIIVQGIASEYYEQLINRASEKGIPIITVDADMPKSERTAYVGTNQWEAGKQLGERLIEAEGSKQYIGVIIGSEEAYNQQIRLQGLTDVINQDMNVQIVAVRSSNISRIEAAKQTVEMLARYPQITTMVGLSSLDAAGIVDGLENIQHATPITVYGFDRLDVTIEMINERKIKATIAQNPEEMGAKAVEAIVSYLAGESLEPEQYIPTRVLDYEELHVK